MNTWNHWQLNCLINSLIRLTTKETPKLRINGIHEGNPLLTSGFTSQRARNAESISVQTVISVFYICHFSVSCSIMLYNVECGAVIARSIFSQTFTKDTPLWGVFCGSSIWLIFSVRYFIYLTILDSVITVLDSVMAVPDCKDAVL